MFTAIHPHDWNARSGALSEGHFFACPPTLSQFTLPDHLKCPRYHLNPVITSNPVRPMMTPTPHCIRIQQHPGSSQEDIENKPDWGAGHQHRIGYCNWQDHIPGLTHQGNEKDEDGDCERKALKEIDQLHNRIQKGNLINFQDAISQQKVSTATSAGHISCNA